MNVRNAFPMGTMYVAIQRAHCVTEHVRLPSGRWITGTLEGAGREHATLEAAYQRWIEKQGEGQGHE